MKVLRGFESYYFLQMRKRYVHKLFIRDIKKLQDRINHLANQPDSDMAFLKALMDLTAKLEEYQDYRNG
jgi:hypothetical protein